MALWGNKDSKTASGTIQVYANGLVTGTSTSFTTQAAAGDYIKANNKEYRIISISNNTTLQVAAGTLGAAVTAVAAGNTYALSEKPIYVSAASVGVDANNVFGVDTAEADVKPVTHSGWVLRTVGTGGRSGRVQYETLVAGGSNATGPGAVVQGDAADDTQFPDA